MGVRQHYLGIDIGGTKVALRVAQADGGADGKADVDADWDRIDEFRFDWPPRDGAAGDWRRLADAAREIARRHSGRLAGVGVAMPAAVDVDGTVAAWPSRPEWVGLDFGARLRGLFPGLPVRWADDGALGALAEARAARAQDAVYLGVGTGIGGGLVLGGRLLPPPGRGSFEIGHTVVSLDGERCVCGRSGCLQALASGPATLRRAARLRGAEAGFDEFRDGVRAGSGWAVAALDESARALAAAITGVRELMNLGQGPAILGGGFAAAVPGLVPAVDREARALARPGFPAGPVYPARCGALSSLAGAVWLAGSAD
jgi:kanosamine 6-kinase